MVASIKLPEELKKCVARVVKDTGYRATLQGKGPRMPKLRSWPR
jgi:hypothetical protein